MKRKILIFCISWCWAICASAINIQSRSLNYNVGLPDMNVRNISFDDKGYMWLGTLNGLYRYDGYTFTMFNYADGDNMRLLNNNQITGIKRIGHRMVIREQGNLYSVFDTHLNRFVMMEQKQMEKLFTYHHDSKDVLKTPLLRPYRDIIAHGGNVIYDDKNNPVVIDNTGMLWHIDKQTGKVCKMKVFDTDLFPLISSHKYKVCLTDHGRMIWVSTNGCGVTVYDRSTDQCQHIRQESGLIATDFILDMCVDQWDNVWVVNEFQGLNRLTASHGKSDTRLLMPHSNLLRDNQVFIIHKMNNSAFVVANTKGDVWVGNQWCELPKKPSYTGLDIHAMLTDAKGGIWIGTRQQGLRAPDGKWYRHDPKQPYSISANNVFSLLLDKRGNLWVAGENASLDLAIKQPDGSYQFKHFLKLKTTIKVMKEDSKGNIWVGTKSGLYRFNPDHLKKNATAYQVELTAKDVRYSDISSIYEDASGRIWVGTIGAGVFIKENGKFQNLTTADGLISNEVHSLIADGKGIMWIATNHGITCYHPVTKNCRYIYNDDKPLANYFTDNCVSKLPDGKLIFGTNYGIRVFNPSVIERRDLNLSRLGITGLQINGVSIERLGDASPLDVAPDDAAEIHLSHNQNSLTFHFSMFNVMGEMGTRYSYMLEGYDPSWSEPSVYNIATYKNLKPGRYVLHVKAYDIRSANSKEKKVVIIVNSPWWATWWAYLCYLCIIAIIAWLIYRQLKIIYGLRRRISIEKELTEYKLVFFTNISHEFRTPLTIIRNAMEHIRSLGTVPAELRQPLSNMGRSTDRMLRLINQLLEFRKMQSGKLHLALEDTEIIGFVRDIFLSFNDVAANKNINYTFTSNVKSYQVPLDRQHIDKVVYNVLSNAFKYTPQNGSIDVCVRIQDGQLVIAIKDTGVGIPKDKQPELFHRFMQSTFSSDSIGIGLHLTKALVEVHHGKIRFEENVPHGSVFVIELPADGSAYQADDYLQKSDLKPAARKPEPLYQEINGEPMNDRSILIVEDDADVLAMLKQVLGHVFHVSAAMDGKTALEMLRQDGKPDLIVSDVMMPIMDGLELTKQVRNDANLKTIPILLLTALESEEQHLKGTECGADAYLTKPFNTRLLISTCRQLIEQRDIMRQQACLAAENTSATAVLPEIIVEERDKHLLDVMNTWLYAHLSDSMLSVDDVAEAMGYRRSIFFKKVKSLTGQTPADYIKTLRMNRAAELLKEENISVAEVCYQVGISDPHYFSKVFKQRFGISPKKYQQGK